MSESDWSLVPDQAPQSGGQGEVTKVRREADGAIGAKKTLHSNHLTSKERRYRMVREVNALKVLNGAGTPRVLDDNSGDWELSNTPLFAVVEWIEGPTLTKFVNGSPKSLDVAIQITSALLQVLRGCHDAGIQHRDVKPDNIILRNSNHNQLYLVDFGMSWSRDETSRGDFETHQGQEIGNRFFRLPEHAAGQKSNEEASDVTFAAGVFWYLLSGRPPRLLRDAQGRAPHEVHDLPRATLEDSRWLKLSRVFNVAFQPAIDMRYQSAVELKHAIENLSPVQAASTALSSAFEMVQQIRESSNAKRLEWNQKSTIAALNAELQSIEKIVGSANFVLAGSGPSSKVGRSASELDFVIHEHATESPTVRFASRVSYSSGQYVASYQIEGSRDWRKFYVGPLADPESLMEACQAIGAEISEQILRIYAAKLNDQTAYPVTAELGITRIEAQIAEYFVKRSEHGMRGDPKCTLGSLAADLASDVDLLQKGLEELERRGWAFVQKALAPSESLTVGPSDDCFIEFDKFWFDWSAPDDAAHLAKFLVEKSPDGVNIEEMESIFKWSIRRMNPAAHYLISHGYVMASESVAYPRKTRWIMQNQDTLSFVRGRS